MRVEGDEDDVITVVLDTSDPRDIERNQRLSGLIDLELGDKSKWVLVYRSENKRSFFVAPGSRVKAQEAGEVLVKMGEGLLEALKKAKKGKK